MGGSDEEMVIDVRVNIHTRRAQNPDGDEIATLYHHTHKPGVVVLATVVIWISR